MPKRILIIGLVFCISGVLSIIDINVSLMHSHINLNLGALLLILITTHKLLYSKKANEYFEEML
jgi:predicted tellurium resistance membrane protein TerC